MQVPVRNFLNVFFSRQFTFWNVVCYKIKENVDGENSFEEKGILQVVFMLCAIEGQPCVEVGRGEACQEVYNAPQFDEHAVVSQNKPHLIL